MTEIRYPFTDKGLLDSLMALGTTPEAVERNLFAMGVRGRRGSECQCPLANYVTRVVEDAQTAYIYQDEAKTELYVMAAHVPQVHVTAVIGGSLAQFVVLFDTGQFDTLEEVPDAA